MAFKFRRLSANIEAPFNQCSCLLAHVQAHRRIVQQSVHGDIEFFVVTFGHQQIPSCKSSYFRDQGGVIGILMLEHTEGDVDQMAHQGTQRRALRLAASNKTVIDGPQLRVVT